MSDSLNNNSLNAKEINNLIAFLMDINAFYTANMVLVKDASKEDASKEDNSKEDNSKEDNSKEEHSATYIKFLEKNAKLLFETDNDNGTIFLKKLTKDTTGPTTIVIKPFLQPAITFKDIETYAIFTYNKDFCDIIDKLPIFYMTYNCNDTTMAEMRKQINIFFKTFFTDIKQFRTDSIQNSVSDKYKYIYRLQKKLNDEVTIHGIKSTMYRHLTHKSTQNKVARNRNKDSNSNSNSKSNSKSNSNSGTKKLSRNTTPDYYIDETGLTMKQNGKIIHIPNEYLGSEYRFKKTPVKKSILKRLLSTKTGIKKLLNKTTNLFSMKASSSKTRKTR